MKAGRCYICKEKKELTYHSLVGHHLPPFIKVCQECHVVIHKPIMKKPAWEKKHGRKFPKIRLDEDKIINASGQAIWVAGKRR